MKCLLLQLQASIIFGCCIIYRHTVPQCVLVLLDFGGRCHIQAKKLLPAVSAQTQQLSAQGGLCCLLLYSRVLAMALNLLLPLGLPVERRLTKATTFGFAGFPKCRRLGSAKMITTVVMKHSAQVQPGTRTSIGSPALRLCPAPHLFAPCSP